MALIQRAMDNLKRDEGFRQFVYDDATGEAIVPGYLVIGQPTIAWGRNLAGRGVSDLEGEYFLRNDVIDVLDDLSTLDFWGTLSESRQVVLVNLAYNLGWRGFLGFRKMLAAVRAEDWDGAAAQILDSKAARQTGDRYTRLAAAMREG